MKKTIKKVIQDLGFEITNEWTSFGVRHYIEFNHEYIVRTKILLGKRVYTIGTHSNIFVLNCDFDVAVKTLESIAK